MDKDELNNKPRNPVKFSHFHYLDPCPGNKDKYHNYVQITKPFQEGTNPHMFATFECVDCGKKDQFSLGLEGYY